MGVGGGPEGARSSWTSGKPGTTVGIYIDADARMVTIVEHCDAANSAGDICMDDVPMPIKLVVQGPKHEI